jgi:hypothetical protein
MELLARLLGGNERVKIMRFFLHNPESIVSLKNVVDKTKSKIDVTRKELGVLLAISFIQKKKGRMYVTVGKGKKEHQVQKEVYGYTLNPAFPHNQALRDLLFDFEAVDKKELAYRFKNIGRIKLFLVAGIFVGSEDSQVDLLIVGEALNRPKAEKIVEVLNSELGLELVYAIMDVEEYEYRFKMYDKFVRGIMELPYEKVVDKLKKAF